MLFPVVNFSKCVVAEVVLVFNCCFQDIDISQGSVATHLTCVGTYSYSVIRNALLIQTEISFKIGRYLMKLRRM